MNLKTPFVITISRQLGSGGEYIGQQLAKRLNLHYADREIINQAAVKLSVLDKELESRDEKVLSFWESFFKFGAFISEADVFPKMMPPTDLQMFNTDAEIIKKIAQEKSSVIMGRCGFYILREYANHISIFLHGDIPSRAVRLSNTYNISEEEARLLIIRKDRERAQYCRAFTGREWTDAKNYNISINTSKINIDSAVELIMNYIKLM